MDGPEDKRPDPLGPLFAALRLYGIVVGAILAFGIEVSLFILLGHWIDGKLNCWPWLTVLGAVLGSGLGLYHLIALVRRLTRGL